MLAFAPTILWQSGTSGNIQLSPENITNVLLGEFQNQAFSMPQSPPTTDLSILWVLVTVLLVSGLFFFFRELIASAKEKHFKLSNDDKAFLASIDNPKTSAHSHQAA